MKTRCTRCKNEIDYQDELPEKCPFCGAKYLFSEKSEIEKIGDINRLDLPKKLKNISPASTSRKFMIPLAFFIDFAWIAIGLFFAFRFYLFPYPLSSILGWAGIILTLCAIYRFIYRVTMGRRLKKAILSGKRDVDELITILALKTRTDVLVLFKKVVKWGFLIGYGVKNGTEIYKEKN